MKTVILTVGILLLAAPAINGCAGKAPSMQQSVAEAPTDMSQPPTAVEVEEPNQPGTPHQPDISPYPGDRLYVLDVLSGSESLAVVDTATGAKEQHLPLGVPGPDWSVLYTVDYSSGQTTVRALDLLSGEPVRETTFDGAYVLPETGPYAVPVGLSPDGGWLVLQGHSTRPAHAALRGSHFAVLDTGFSQPPVFVDLIGMFTFDAISSDGTALYLIEDLSHEQPNQYQVRLYDVAQGRLRDGAIADKSGSTVMRGRYTTSVASPDGTWLYSLYVKDDAGPFIHALNLGERFAVCIFLPTDGAGDLYRQMFWSLALSADGRSLYAANGSLGVVAEVSTVDHKVRSTAKLDIAWAGNRGLLRRLTRWLVPVAEAKRMPVGGAALSPDGETLFVLAERGLLAISTDDLSLHDHYLADDILDSVAVSPDGRLYTVVLRYPNKPKIARLDSATGAVDAEVVGTWPRSVLHAEPSQPTDGPAVFPTDIRDESARSEPRVGPESCAVTQPPDPAFVPPSPYPAEPPGEDRFWHGTETPWTALPVDGTWQQLLYGEKVFWWREGYVWNEEPQPELTVTGRRLDGPAPVAEVSRATNAFHPSFNSAMLVGLDLPAPGCWEITGRHGNDELTFVVWVAISDTSAK